MRKILTLGVATKIYIEKMSGYHYFSKAELLEELKDDINLELYEIFEDMEYVILIPKDDLFIKYIGDLLASETLKMQMDDDSKIHMGKVFESLKKLKDAKEFKKVLVKSPCTYFLYMHGGKDENISYIYSGKKDMTIFCDMVGFGYCDSVYL